MKFVVKASRVALLLCLAVGLAPAVRAQVSRTEMDSSIKNNVGDPLQFQQTMTTLQQAVAKHDAAAVAALVSYPITVNPHTKAAIRVRTPRAFVARYDSIITPHISEVVKKQKYEELFVNDQGAMFGAGEIWLVGICKDKQCKQADIRLGTIQNTSGKAK